MEEVILIGYFIETEELCKKCGCSVVGVVDNEPKGPYPYLGNDEEFILKRSEYNNIPLVVTPDKPDIRGKVFEKYKEHGFTFKTLIAPEAVISETARISEGCMVQSLCNVSSNVFLDTCVRVNTGANIMHDCNVGAYSVVAPNAVLLGHVTVGTESYVGANSTLLPNISIGNNATIGAGAVVTKNVDDGVVVVGVPARILKK
jgi:sugar O-acyltransferase (sialic acid O-acetyltransferase NeuD family)